MSSQRAVDASVLRVTPAMIALYDDAVFVERLRERAVGRNSANAAPWDVVCSGKLRPFREAFERHQELRTRLVSAEQELARVAEKLRVLLRERAPLAAQWSGEPLDELVVTSTGGDLRLVLRAFEALLNEHASEEWAWHLAFELQPHAYSYTDAFAAFTGVETELAKEGVALEQAAALATAALKDAVKLADAVFGAESFESARVRRVPESPFAGKQVATLCKTCKKDIPTGALKCTACGGYQGGVRSVFNVSSTVLSLLVALVSVLGAAIPPMIAFFTPQVAEVTGSIGSISVETIRGGKHET